MKINDEYIWDYKQYDVGPGIYHFSKTNMQGGCLVKVSGKELVSITDFNWIYVHVPSCVTVVNGQIYSASQIENEKPFTYTIPTSGKYNFSGYTIYNPITGHTEEVEDEEEYDPYFPNSQQGILGGKDYHTCSFKSYVGFVDFYDYCIYCDKKREFTGKLPE